MVFNVDLVEYMMDPRYGSTNEYNNQRMTLSRASGVVHNDVTQFYQLLTLASLPLSSHFLTLRPQYYRHKIHDPSLRPWRNLWTTAYINT